MTKITFKPDRLKKPVRFWVASAMIFIAFFFRFYRLADHPLGLFFDPAINGLDATRLIERGGLTLFFPTNGGRESLFMYLLVPLIWLFGTTPFTMRLLTATFSLLTVATTFGLMAQFRNSKGLSTSLLPYLTTLILAVSYWHIAVSRLGQRPIMVPLVAVTTFWLFLKGWHNGQTRWFIGAGICLGFGAYTYPAARLLPVILGLAVLPEFFLKSKIPNLKSKIFILTMSAILTASPMIAYFVTYPLQFSTRAGSVTVWHFLHTPVEIITELGRNIFRVIGFFGYIGSLNPIFGLPGQPGLSILLAPFLLVGIIFTIRKWRDLPYRLVILWWFIGIAPSVVAIEAPHPLRMIVAVVPTAILVAVGQASCLSMIDRQDACPTLRKTIFYTLPFLLICATIPRTFQAYFVEWTTLPVTRGIYDYNAVTIRKVILAYADQNVPIYLPFGRFNDSSLLYYLSDSFKREAKFSIAPSARAMVISPPKNFTDTTWIRLFQHTATVLPPLTISGQHLIQTALTANTAQPIYNNEEEAARLAYLPTDPANFLLTATHQMTANFGSLELTGATYPTVISTTARKLPITLFWIAHTPMAEEYKILIHLVNDKRQVFGNGDARPNDWVYPTTFWRPYLDEIAASHTLKIESGALSPGRYWLAIAVYHPMIDQRIPLSQPTHDSPNTTFIGPLKVALPPIAQPNQAPIATFGDSIQLYQATIDAPTIKADEAINLTLLWQAIATPPLDYTVFVHLLDNQNNLVTGNDSPPCQGNYPTTIWSPHELILDTHTIPIPNSLPPNKYRLAIGLYHQPSGQRLPLRQPDGGLVANSQLEIKIKDEGKK